MSRRLVSALCLTALGLTLSAGVLFACSDSAADPSSGADAAAESAVPGDGATPNDAGGGDAAKTTCSITRAYFEGCGYEADLNCGAKFDAWCTQSDQAINSVAYRNAEAECLTTANCDGKKRRDCEYAHYNSETPTASEAALVAAYCETCEPSDIAGCTTRATKFDTTKGQASVGDIFIAAWELADPLCDEIKAKCTGPALDGGADASVCAKAFGGCSGDIYFDALPDCPK